MRKSRRLQMWVELDRIVRKSSVGVKRYVDWCYHGVKTVGSQGLFSVHCLQVLKLHAVTMLQHVS